MPIRSFSRLYRSVGWIMALLLMLGPGLASVAQAQEGGGAIHGVLYQQDEKSRLMGAQVAAINVTTGQHYVSNVTGQNGVYEITGLPQGTFDIVVQSGGNIYVAENLIDLEKNQRLSLSYAVQPTKPANREIKNMPPPSGAAAIIGDLPSSPVAGRSGGFWTSKGGVTTIVLLAVGAGLVIANRGDGDKDASPSTP